MLVILVRELARGPKDIDRNTVASVIPADI